MKLFAEPGNNEVVDRAIDVGQLIVNYEESSVLWDINFFIPEKKLVAILGPNGAGKSTLLKALLGIIKPLSGNIFFWGKPLEKVRKRVGYVPQRSSVDWDFPITAFDLVMMGCYGKMKLLKWVSKEDHKTTYEALELVEMLPFAKRQIGQLSGGQQQRLFIARALAQKADIYLLDEPFSGIDISTEKTLVKLFKELRQQGKTIICVHHDLSSVDDYFDWVVLLNTCLIGAGSISDVFNLENIKRTYGRNSTLLDEAIFKTKKKTDGLL